MVMKDKLYKSNHKGIYYKTRKSLIAGAVVLGVFTMVSVPTYINAKKQLQVEKKALREYIHCETAEEEVNHEVKDQDKEVKNIYVTPKTDVGPTYKFVKK